MKHQEFNDRDLALFSMELAMFLRAGMSISSSLTLIADETADPHRKQALLTMAQSADNGIPLSDAAKESGIFPSAAVSMLKIGETTGRMEETLSALHSFCDSRDNTVRQIRSALLYPSVLLFVMLAVIGLLAAKVLPIYGEVYAMTGGQLTGAAGLLLNLGNTLTGILPLLILMGILICAGILLLLFTQKGQRILHTGLERTKIARKIRTAGFAHALYMGIASGLSPEEAVENAGLLLSGSECDRCLRLLDNGIPLADALEESGLMPHGECRLLHMGLISGTPESTALEIAGRLERDAGLALEGMISRIEPALVLTASVLIGGILIGIMIPLTGLMQGMGGL